jgi:hypothetical protein
LSVCSTAGDLLLGTKSVGSGFKPFLGIVAETSRNLVIKLVFGANVVKRASQQRSAPVFVGCVTK